MLEDRRVLAGIDFGDAIDLTDQPSAGDYQTVDANHGAAHVITSGLYLGRTVDADNGTQQNAKANADDHSNVLADFRTDHVAAIDRDATLIGTLGTVPATGEGTWQYFTSTTTNPTDSNAALSPMVWDTGMRAFEDVSAASQTDGFNGSYLGFPSGLDELALHPVGTYGRKAVARWVAGPNESGLIDIEGSVRKTNLAASDGIRFFIYVDGIQQYETFVEGLDGRGRHFAIHDVDIKPGSTVDLVVDQNGRSDFDGTNPLLSVQQLTNGWLSFEVELGTSEVAEVAWTMSSGEDITAVLVNGFPSEFFAWKYDAATDTGVTKIGPGRLQMRFRDGLVGDLDGAADGKISSVVGSAIGVGQPVENPVNPFDVNNDGRVSPLDALLVINAYVRALDPKNPSFPIASDRFIDVSADGRVSPLDALLVINQIVKNASRGEGESYSAAAVDEVLTSTVLNNSNFGDPLGTETPVAATLLSDETYESLSRDHLGTDVDDQMLRPME